MAIIGIHSVEYGVDDLEGSATFFTDMGLQPVAQEGPTRDFRLRDGSSVVLRGADDPVLPGRFEMAPGVRRVTWAVDTPQSLSELEQAVAVDRKVARVGELAIAFVDDAGVPTMLAVAQPVPVHARPELVNAPGRVERWNRNRQWPVGASPSVMQHVVFATPDVRRAAAFYVNRLGFRISDIQDGGGYFLRADGRSEHHNIFWQPGQKLAFRHLAFGVENIDELMVGATNMLRRGWTSELGLGRHRISSTFFYYFACPAGGDAEYSTDTDYLDDDWVPRVWDRAFGHIWWCSRPRAHDPTPKVRLSTPEERAL